MTTDAKATGDNETTLPPDSQQANANTENANTENANTENANTENANTDKPQNVYTEWKGDNRYFQTGKKAGRLKPSRNLDGLDAKKASVEFEGLDTAALRSSVTTASPSASPATDTPETKKKPTKAEKKIIEAQIASKLVMRMLDTVVGFISKGQYGATFTPDQAAKRNKYREELEQDWNDYLQTVEVPMHPALVVAFGSINYCADAFNTPAGQERTKTLKEKIFGKLAAKLF